MISEVEMVDRMEYLSKFPDKYFFLASDDPPYFDGPNKRKFYGNEISPIKVKRIDYPITESWGVPEKEYFDELFRVSRHQIIWGVNYYNYQFPSSGRIIWDKANGDSSFSDCEIAFCSFHDSVRMYRFMWNGMMQGKSVNEGHLMQGNKKLNENRIHQCQKPIALYKWQFDKYMKEGGKIISPHVGSGSDRIAAHDLGYDFYGCELNEDHFKNQNKRFENHILQQRLF